MGFYDGKQMLDVQLQKIFNTAKAKGMELDLDVLVAQLSIDCSPIGPKTVMSRILLYEKAGKIGILGKKVVVV